MVWSGRVFFNSFFPFFFWFQFRKKIMFSFRDNFVSLFFFEDIVAKKG